MGAYEEYQATGDPDSEDEIPEGICIKCGIGDSTTDKDYGEKCDTCRAEEDAEQAERAYDRMVEGFYGASTPQTDRERYAEAAEFKRKLG
jgi:hypothetical protein